MRLLGLRIFGALLVAALLCPGLVVAESQSYTCTAGAYRLEQAGNGKYFIKMLDAGYGEIQSPGDPVLPMKTIDIKVPAELDLSDLTITISNVVSMPLNGNYEITPQLPLVSDSIQVWGTGKKIIDGKNIEVYNQNTFFPKQSVELLPYLTNKERDPNSKDHPFKMMKYIRFIFMPFQYNPILHTLNFVSKATVTFDYNNKVNANFKPSTKSGTALGADYVIITANATVLNSTRLANFVAMKQFQGHTVKIVTETDFNGLTGQAPNGRAEKIRKWLQDNYAALGIDYVLLIGDPTPDDPFASGTVGDIPMKMCYPRFYEPEDRVSPTDFYYSDLVGNWDLDGDGTFGVDFSSTNATSPVPGTIQPTTFSAEWTGKFKCDNDNICTFSTFSDDGVKLWVDGNLIIDNWTDHPPTYDAATPINLTTGFHTIKLDYFQNGGKSVIRLYWQNNTNFTSRWPMPSSHLFHSVAGVDVAGGLDVTYFDNIDFTGPTVPRVDPSVDFIWGTGDNGTNQRRNASQVFVGRIPMYNNDYSALDDILDKTIKYESANLGSIAWRKSILLPMNKIVSSIPEYYLAEEIRNNFALADGFTCYRIYEADYAGTGGPTPENFPNSFALTQTQWINNPNSRGMVTWSAHGSSAGAQAIFNIGIAQYLDNTKPSFTFQSSCDNGWPERNDNLGYVLLQHGAIATVSASRVAWFGGGPADQPTNTSAHCLAYAYTKNVIDAGKSAGEASSAYKAALTEVDMNVMVFNVYGDPDCYLLQTFPNQPPIANAGGPYAVDEGSSVTLDASASSDPEGSALQYRWDLYNDGTWDIDWSSSPTNTYSMGFPQTYTVALQVKDALGLITTTTTQVTFLNVAPVAEAGSDQITSEGTNVSFSGSFTDPGWESHTYTWDFGDGSGTAGLLNPVHAFGDVGVYNVKLTVTDQFGASGSDIIKVTVNNVPSTVSINSVSPSVIFAGQSVSFQGSFSDVGWVDYHTSMWDFGDGTSSAGTLTEVHISPVTTGTALVAKTYTIPGVYTVKLTITDAHGCSGIATKTITVLGSLLVSQTLTICDNSKVYSAGTFGGTYSEIGSLGLLKTGMLYVNGDSYLRSQSKIDGSVTVAGLCRKQDNTPVITGPVIQGVPVTIPAIPAQTVAVGTADKTVNSNQTDTWTPGTYRDGIVRGKVTLVAGTYNFRNLTFDGGAKLVLNTSSGAIYINANALLSFGNGMQITYSDPAKVFYYSNYTGILPIGTDNTIKAASIIAPYANITVYSRSTVNAVICGKQFSVQPNCTVNCGM
jgi:PKD repeat protein